MITHALPRQKLIARAIGKLCFAAQKLLFVQQNQLAPDPQSGGIASKVGNRGETIIDN